MTIDIAIKTIDRSEERVKWSPQEGDVVYPAGPNFLGATIQNLRRAGVFKSPHLGRVWIVDGGSSQPARFLAAAGLGNVMDFAYVFDTRPRTLQQNAQRAIEVVGGGESKWGMVMEDDIDVIDGFLDRAVEWLETHQLHDPCMYVFGANYTAIQEAWSRRLPVWMYPVDDFYGALCCAWTRGQAAQLAEWLGPDPYIVNKEGYEVRHHGHDLHLARWGKAMGLSHFLCTAPNYVQHIGEHSGLNNRMIRYPGFQREIA